LKIYISQGSVAKQLLKSVW